jgi:hypothetical protein
MNSDKEQVDNYAARLQGMIQEAPRVNNHIYQDLSDLLSHGLKILLTNYRSIRSKHENRG